MASTIDSPGSSSDFAKRMELAWLISQQPRPIPCSSCQSAGHVECKWCTGTGFFILGNNMLASQLVLIAKELGFVPSGLRILLSTNEAEEVYHTAYINQKRTENKKHVSPGHLVYTLYNMFSSPRPMLSLAEA
uniref:Uncharacterized protein n=1 Tax=Oryza barthii TaxID=65489 RepID=A0A0D3H701_9ORYZ